MIPVIFYFRLHHPCLLHPERDKFLWDERNRETSRRRRPAATSPHPDLTALVARYPEFKAALSVSGTFLDQAELYRSELIKALQEFLDAGRDGERVEFLDETHYHSLAGLFEDPRKQEFRDQVSLHRDRMAKHFGIRPVSFCNTDLICNNDIAAVVSDMGYSVTFCESLPPGLAAGTAHRAPGSQLLVIPRDRDLSDFPGSGPARDVPSPRSYLERIAKSAEGIRLLAFNLENLGAPGAAGETVHDFWRGLAEALPEFPGIDVVTPSGWARTVRAEDCPVFDIPAPAGSDRAALESQTGGWLDDPAQLDLFRDIEKMEEIARKAGGDLLAHWRHLTAADHLFFCPQPQRRGDVPEH